METQDLNQQRRITLPLQQDPPHAGLRGNEKCLRGAQGLARVGMTGWPWHSQGLKPDSLRRIGGTAKAMP